MRCVFLFTAFWIFDCNLSKAISVFDVSIWPPNPTTQDSVKIKFSLAMTDYGLKFSDNLIFVGDSVFYEGCFKCGCIEQTDVEVLDSFLLHPLNTGTYHVRIIARFAESFSDTVCIAQPTWKTIVDTFFTVSETTSAHSYFPSEYGATLINFRELRITTEAEEDITVNVTDALGRELYTGPKTYLREGENILNLNLPDLPTGFYFYQLQIDDQRKVLKVVKQ